MQIKKSKLPPTTDKKKTEKLNELEKVFPCHTKKTVYINICIYIQWQN